MNRTLRTFFLLLAFAFVACGKKEAETPQGVLSSEQMISVLADIHIAEARLQIADVRSSNPDLKNKYVAEVLSRHKINTSVFARSFDYYSSHPEIFSQMYEKVIEEISKKQAASKKK